LADGTAAGPQAQAELVLTERTADVEFHRGQVSFPGGTLKPGESPRQAALRETLEETGIAVARDDLIGQLSELWIPATGFTVTPVVAIMDQRPRASQVNPREVARMIELPLHELLRAGAVRRAARTEDGRWTHIPYFEAEGAWLWGATAMMTAELLVLLGWPGPGG
jgi:8-oxo-dGTP pyrophosphatase MutT (NUDIX family)